MRGRVEVVGSSILEAYQFRAVHLNPVGPSVRGDRMGASPPSWSTLPHHFEAARRRASEDARFTEVKRPARRREAVDVPTGHDCYSTSEVNRVCTCFLRSRPAGSRPSREASARRRPRAPLRSALIRPRSEPPCWPIAERLLVGKIEAIRRTPKGGGDPRRVVYASDTMTLLKGPGTVAH